MTARMVGRRLVEDKLKMAFLFVVSRRWPWQQENFYSENEIEFSIIEGCLEVVVDGVTRIYSSRNWRKIISKQVPVRERV